ncbi:MAG: MraY family glycosyltransferase [Candidatus Hydrogenedentota bacterium]
MNWYLIYGYIFAVSLGLSLLLTALARRYAIRWNVLDAPGERKMHHTPIPLMGGVAIFLTFHLVIGAHHLGVQVLPLTDWGFEWVDPHILGFLGAEVTAKLAGIILGGLVIFALGLADDVLLLSPGVKLIGQLMAAGVLVGFGIRLNLFIPYPLVTALLTILWVVTMVNAMNFLDNMDGLAGGVSVVAAFSFFLCAAAQGQTFVSVLLMVFAGATAGFLYHNLPPARIFMGDAGSMFCGYVLATAPILATFYTPNGGSRIAVAAPLVALSVPLFDIVTVVYIRWRNGESIMKGDKRHFSHRLVELGMTPRQAVEFIFLVAGICGLSAALLPQVAFTGTLIILAQVAGIYLLIVLLMNANAKGQAASYGQEETEETR